MIVRQFITDAEIVTALDGTPNVDLIIDDLDRHVETQKPEGRDARDRAAVEVKLKERGISLRFDHD